MQLVLDKSGRMVLPKAVRDDFALEPGDLLDLQEQSDCIVLRPVNERSAVKSKNGLLVVSSAPAGDLRKAVAAHRQTRLRRAAGWGDMR
ncbi:MAG: AbrB/MazE/SpoVT family DNA-binding domain-containing protein [Verrucomicrobia bacterium]|jgi:AbrB family looped-hinge helix DNA binding protein|nr:AbrB/MazE/SpoVT family DNA-binding domain-containing protein [Verrucomicrobiota bacterium]MBT7700638.1 AbrB/MazE/SpoVT family DNA-binding domain-containing protein [Verrucomicrobiota bacterium]